MLALNNLRRSFCLRRSLRKPHLPRGRRWDAVDRVRRKATPALVKDEGSTGRHPLSAQGVVALVVKHPEPGERASVLGSAHMSAGIPPPRPCLQPCASYLLAGLFLRLLQQLFRASVGCTMRAIAQMKPTISRAMAMVKPSGSKPPGGSQRHRSAVTTALSRRYAYRCLMHIQANKRDIVHQVWPPCMRLCAGHSAQPSTLYMMRAGRRSLSGHGG
jgi:hypothetical protein